MTQQIINIGAAPNDGQGDPVRTAFAKTNNNFSQLYSIAQSSPPPTLTGSTGDFAGMYAYDSNYFYYCFANYTGNSVIWAQITQAGNISVSAINNGNSNISIGGVGANATVSVRGTSNVAVFSNAGILLSGVVSAAGNVRGGNLNTAGRVSAAGNVTGNYILGNGSQLTGLPATYSNANVASYLPVYSGDITGNNISATGNIVGNNISAASVISATGNIETAGYFVGTFIGNVTGNFVIPGSNTQVVFNTNGNADAVGGMTYNKGTNTFVVLGTISSQGNTIGGNIVTAGLITAAGNVYAGNITGGNILTGGLISATGSINTDATVVAQGNIRGGNLISNGLITATGNVTGGNVLTGGTISAAGNISGNYIRANVDINAGGNVTAVNVNANVASLIGNIYSGNILTTGLVSATGNVTGNYFVGNGSQLTGLPATYGNANVTNFLSAFGSNVINTTGNISVGLISSTGNITAANYFIGNGSQLTGVVATGIGTLTSLSVSGNITAGNIINNGSESVVGNITAGNLSVSDGTVTVGNIVAAGNAIGNIGSSANAFNTVFAQATSAQYADLAECYLADADYPPGTVVSFGGSAEVTVTATDADPLIAGVVSTRPAHLMNSGLAGNHVTAVALVGRVPCQVTGPVAAGAMMVSAGNGCARAEANPAMGTVIGKAVQAFDGVTGTIEIVVGRI